MSPFGLFDLLKTLLPPAEQPNPSPSPSASDTPTETNAQSSPSTDELPQNQPPKNNACADFLYRHEQRAQTIKDTKKRLD